MDLFCPRSVQLEFLEKRIQNMLTLNSRSNEDMGICLNRDTEVWSTVFLLFTVSFFSGPLLPEIFRVYE